eukprot:1157261-Pelagomonas_calceolata.AAC.6
MEFHNSNCNWIKHVCPENCVLCNYRGEGTEVCRKVRSRACAPAILRCKKVCCCPRYSLLIFAPGKAGFANFPASLATFPSSDLVLLDISLELILLVVLFYVLALMTPDGQ